MKVALQRPLLITSWAIFVLTLLTSAACSNSGNETSTEPLKAVNAAASAPSRIWPPLELKGVKVGVDSIQSVKDWNGDHPCKKAGSTSIPGRRTCSAVLHVADVHTDASFISIDDIVHQIFGTTKSENFELFKRAFIEKYGLPTDEYSEQLQNGFGAMFTNVVVNRPGYRGGPLVLVTGSRGHVQISSPHRLQLT